MRAATFNKMMKMRKVVASGKCQFCGVEIVFLHGDTCWRSIADGRDKCPTLEKPVRRHCPSEPR